jgi:3-dehydroquinate synthase
MATTTGDGTEHWQRFAVRFEYPVVFTEGAFEPQNEVLAAALARLEPDRRQRVLAVIDAGVAQAWPELAGDVERYASVHADAMQLVAPPLVVPGGEAVKNDRAELERVYRTLHAARLDRHAFVVIVGGGAVQDMVGYAAATTHRGLRVVRLPTTVLAQNDAGVGVKNAVNAFGTKNFLGTFAPPFAVVDDFRFLETLPARDRRAGLSEAVKVALIKDAGFFDWLEERAAALAAGEREATAAMVRRSATLHLDHIAGAGDPFEQGSARPLDYGHWSAHKLETLSDHELRHGEAVAIGMALDARIASTEGSLDDASCERACGLLERLGLRLWHDALGARDGGRLRVLDGLDEFREHLGGTLTVRMLTAVGASRDVHEVDPALVEEAVGWLRARARGAP